MAHQQRSLQGQADVLGHLAGAVLDGRRIGQTGLQSSDVGVEAAVVTGCFGQFVEEHLDTLGSGCHGAQGVQRADVPGALPDTHQRRLPVEPRHAGLLGIAVATQAFHRLAGVRGGPLAYPVLGCGQSDAAQQGLALVAADSGVGGAGHPHRDDGRRLGFHGEVGDHVAHQRLVDQIRTERFPVLGVVDGARQALSHAGGTAQGAIQPGQVDHLDDGRHAAAFLTDQPGGGAVVLDLTGGVGVVAEFVLEPRDDHPVAGTVGQHPRQHETAQPVRGLGQHQEDIPHRR